MIIVGGGVAGLSAGVYAQRCGFDSTIFEFHHTPGGVCTSWAHGPYVLDVGLRMLIGTSPENPFHELYQEVGLAPRVRFIPMEEFHCVEDETGHRLRFPRDPRAFQREMLAVAPHDATRIEKFLSILQDFSRFRPRLDSSLEIRRMREGLRSLGTMRPVWKHFLTYMKVPLREWAMQFESERLRQAFLRIYPIVDFPVLAMFSSLGWFMAGHVGRPEGGALAIARAIADEYAQRGGDLRCGQRVEKILVREDRAMGVRLADGSEHMADVVVSAADGRSTIFEMLEGRYVDDTIRQRYDSLPIFKPLVMVHFGLQQDLPEQPESMYFPTEPFRLFGRTIRSLNMHVSRDAWAAPAGRAVVRVGLETEYDPWAVLRRDDPASYRDKKREVADLVLTRLEKRFPGFTGSVDLTDVATPVTMHRYTLNWRGAYEGWQPSTRTFGLRMSRTLPGLDSFYMTGQWVEPGGGIPGVVFSARHTMHLLSHEHGGRPVW